MRDILPRKVLKNESGIINLDTPEGRGTHWTAYYKEGDEIQYYDSFGFPPPIGLCIYLGINTGAKILYNSEQLQRLNQVNCGHLCLLFLSQFVKK